MGSFVTYVPQDDRRSVILSREAAKNPREPVILSEAKDPREPVILSEAKDPREPVILSEAKDLMDDYEE